MLVLLLEHRPEDPIEFIVEYLSNALCANPLMLPRLFTRRLPMGRSGGTITQRSYRYIRIHPHERQVKYRCMAPLAWPLPNVTLVAHCDDPDAEQDNVSIPTLVCTPPHSDHCHSALWPTICTNAHAATANAAGAPAISVVQGFLESVAASYKLLEDSTLQHSSKWRRIFVRTDA